jgi:hypothetical protein
VKGENEIKGSGVEILVKWKEQMKAKGVEWRF